MLRDMNARNGADAMGDAAVCATLTALHASKYTFHLAGSRYFGCEHAGSDWDVVVQDALGVRDFLEALGFVTMAPARSEDGEYTNDAGHTVDVMALGKVQVQLARSVETRIKARDIISQHFAAWHLSADKEQRCALWTAVQDAIEITR